ncbi:MAG: DMT family transporter [Oscillospiraceae bacterium]|nr:DMT family transporter [Oscillospiraceae bacterium]
MAANLLWGSAAACIKLGYGLFQIPEDAVMSQILFAGMRFAMAGLMTILFGSLLNRKLLFPGKTSWKMVFILAMTQTVIQYTFFYMGLSKAPGFMGSVTSPSSVFFAVLLSSLVLHQENLSLRKILGCLIGFAGIIVINLNRVGEGSGFRMDGEGLLILSAFSYACSSVLIKRFSQRENPVTLSGWQFAIGGSVMILVSLLAGGSLHPVSQGAWILLLYLAFVSSAAYTLWSLLLQRHPVSRITVYSFANPVFGVFLSALILGEGDQLNLPYCILALLLVGIGIWTVNSEAGVKQSKS